MFLQIVLVSCLAVFANAQIDVTGCTSYSAATTKCNSDYPIIGGDALTWGSVAGFYSVQADIYCNATNKDNFKMAASCVQKAFIACAKNDFHKFVPSADGIEDGVEYFCDNYADFDIGCISEIGTCAGDKAPVNETAPAMSEGFDKNKEYYCGGLKFLGDCIDSNNKLKNCAKTKSKEIFMQIAKEITLPACDSTSIVISSVLLFVSLFITL